ncbi:unnamed protein product [Lactuca virosa]|uniref:Calreticulin n=1 Tax=Lactuca virosa TaxID=75947 RepID=A0AAU9PHI7_9ASTR|nr:unnamed protein product [Lactuca virosa]
MFTPTPTYTSKTCTTAKKEMARNKSQKKSFFSFFSNFRFKKGRRGADEAWDDSMKAYKVYPSDQDRAGQWADPRIDSKASAYIHERTNRWNNVEVSS